MKGKVVKIMHDCRRRITEALRDVADAEETRDKAMDKLAAVHAEQTRLLADIQQEVSADAGAMAKLAVNRMRRAMAKRSVHPSSTPYGFRAEAGKVSDHPKEIPVLHTILRMRIEGKSLAHIADELSKSNAPTRKGNSRWFRQIVKDICDRAGVRKGN